MSGTRVESKYTSGNYVEIEGTREVVHMKTDSAVWMITPKHEFIAAVEKELDATVILHSDLPDVEVKGNWIRVNGFDSIPMQADPSAIRARAMRDLAAAAYLEKNPPVDAKQVEAVASLITKNLLGQGVGETRTQALARALVQQGVRVEVTE